MKITINSTTGDGTQMRFAGTVIKSPEKLARYTLLIHRPCRWTGSHVAYEVDDWMISEASTGQRMLSYARDTRAAALAALNERFTALADDRIAAVIASAKCLNPEWKPK